MPIADLHIHSRFSRATSKEGDAPHLDLWARRKGIAIVGTGDATHPAWRAELREMLCEDGSGLYSLRPELRLPDAVQTAPPRFVLSSEISCIYKQDGRTRKIHVVFLHSSLDAADRFSALLERIGNIRSDGRPILGLSAHDLLSLALEADPDVVCIPAHIWTPHFSLFGAFSGFDRLEDCFGDLSGHIHALETGLSSDPPMNWRVSALDKYTLVSNSDCHSPAKLGREANLIAPAEDFAALRRIIETGVGFEGTIEFFPEEGKYHMDGHRACGVCLTPAQTLALGGKCPVCGKKLTVGVDHRVNALADRADGFKPERAKPFERLVPLPEVVGAALGVGAESKRAKEQYEKLLAALGDEFSILRSVPVEAIRSVSGELIAEGVRRVRSGEVEWTPGYDGEFGRCTIFTESQRREFIGQTSLFASAAPKRSKKAAPAAPNAPVKTPEAKPTAASENAEQAEAIAARESAVAVIAGPGSGKTRTLVSRIEALLREGVPPQEITAVTFTNLAAAEMRSRLAERLGESALIGMTVGTFHSVCLRLLAEKPLLTREESDRLLRRALQETGSSLKPAQAAEAVSRFRSGESEEHAELARAYCALLAEQGKRDLDGLLLEALETPVARPAMFRHLLVDEYQDINGVQRRLVAHWSAQSASLFVIGDPDQSIYGFRGASAACFDDLSRERPDLRVIRLAKNYRSTPEICSAALRLISANPGLPRVLEPVLPCGAPVRLLQAANPHEEAAAIAREIVRISGGLDMIEAGKAERDRSELRAFSDVAVLCRTHRQLELIEEHLLREDIPCTVSGRQSWLDDPALLQALEAFRKSDDPAPPRRLIERWIAENGTSEALSRLAEVSVLYETMPALLEALCIGEEADIRRSSGKQRPSGAVRLMTLHGAKGLEFPVVFLAGLSEGAFPPHADSDIAEERRLLFVGMTRAREELILTCAAPHSPFVPELLPGCIVERIRPRPPKAQQLSFF